MTVHLATEGISPLVLKRGLGPSHSLYYRYVFLEYETFALGVEGGALYRDRKKSGEEEV